MIKHEYLPEERMWQPWADQNQAAEGPGAGICAARGGRGGGLEVEAQDSAEEGCQTLRKSRKHRRMLGPAGIVDAWVKDWNTHFSRGEFSATHRVSLFSTNSLPLPPGGFLSFEFLGFMMNKLCFNVY